MRDQDFMNVTTKAIIETIGAARFTVMMFPA